MIFYKDLGRNGRCGNMLFQAASVIGLARHFGHEYELPKWELAKYFEHPFKMGDTKFFDRAVREDGFLYNEEFWKQNLQDKREKVNLLGYFQSPNYWQQDREFARNLFTFEKSFAKRMDKKLKKFKGQNIALHVRRGDYVGNPGYFNLSIDYYKRSLKLMPKGNVIVFTDNYNYCKNMFIEEDVCYDFEGMSDIEHLYLMTKCDHFVVSNSTFSWWGAYLGEKKHSVVTRPNKYFLAHLSDHSVEQFWPKHWQEVEAKQDMSDLSDVTFIIPISYDSKDRKKNMEVLLRFLVKNFKAKIILGEQGSGEKFRYMERYVYKYIYFHGMQKFHRTKMINDMVKMSDTTIVVICDSDVLIPSSQMVTAADKIRNGEADIVYPYDGSFIKCNRSWTDVFNADPYRVNQMTEIYENMNKTEKPSVGGIFLADKTAYESVGMENENFISFGREDVERFVRFKNLGLTVHRENGNLYHMQHQRTLNSTMRHQDAKGNYRECKKVVEMEVDELREYVNGWNWIN